MVIAVGNKKGGTGKSTVVMLLAYYLSYIRGHKISVIDMDEGQSISTKAERDKILENEPNYEVIECPLAYFPALLKMLAREKESTVLIDLPGRMEEDGFITVIMAADVILSPFNYDEFTMDATLLFALVCLKIKPSIQIVFIPNRVKTAVRYETRMEADLVLKKFGIVCPGISERVDFQRITTLHLPADLLPVVQPLLDLLYNHYLFNKSPQDKSPES